MVDIDDTEVQELPILARVAAFLRWLEELVVLISGPLLMAGLGIGLVALLSDGALLVNAPWLVYAWAISQTVGVDGQLVGAWYRVSVAVGRQRFGVAAAYTLLGLILAYVAFVAALVFATQQAYHLTMGQALARLGMDATSWLWQRSAVSVLLVCLSGYLRYRAPRKHVKSLDERKRAIQEQMELEALKAQQRTQRAQAAIGLVKGLASTVRRPDIADTPARLGEVDANRTGQAANVQASQFETMDAEDAAADLGVEDEAERTLRPFVGTRRASR